jgi:DNA-binding NarL/FixJ family response regulator
MTRVLLVDDHRLLRHSLKAALDAVDDIEVIAEAEEGRGAIRLVCDLAPDVVIMDVSMPGLSGIEASRRIIRESPGCRVLALSMYADRRYVLGMLQAGACGYLLKTCSFDELVTAVRRVMNGQVFLSPEIANLVVEYAVNPKTYQLDNNLDALTVREREVLQLVAEGNTSRQIAEILSLSGRTVESHRRQIMEKLQLRSVAELTKFAVRMGLTALE